MDEFYSSINCEYSGEIDVVANPEVFSEILGVNLFEEEGLAPGHPSVESVMFNGPATILFWDDGAKTVVKCPHAKKCKVCSRNPRDWDKAVAEIQATDDPEGRVKLTKKYTKWFDKAQGRCISPGSPYDPEYAIMAAMLKRLYHGWQQVVRKELGYERP